MNKWDIVLVPFPFTDLATTKVRPALIISPSTSTLGEDALFMAISSRITGLRKYDIPLPLNDPEFSQTGLRFPSTIKVSKLFTIQQSSVIRKLGTLGPILQAKVEKQLRDFLELPPFQQEFRTSTQL